MGYYDNTKVGHLNKKAPKPKRPKRQPFRIKDEDKPTVLAFIAALAFVSAFGIFFGLIYFIEWFGTLINGFVGS